MGNLTFCLTAIMSCLLDIWSSLHFCKLIFCQLDILSTHHFINSFSIYFSFCLHFTSVCFSIVISICKSTIWQKNIFLHKNEINDFFFAFPGVLVDCHFFIKTSFLTKKNLSVLSADMSEIEIFALSASFNKMERRYTFLASSKCCIAPVKVSSFNVKMQNIYWSMQF